MPKLMLGINLGDKYIEFNKTQAEYFNALFAENSDGGLCINSNPFKEFVFFGGYRAGKSFIQQLCIWLICVLYPNTRCIYVRNTYPELKDTVIPQFRGEFEKYNFFKYVESSKDGSHIAKFTNGSEIRFRSADEPTKLLSAEYDVIALCQAEAISHYVVNNILIGRWSGTNLPKKLLLIEGNTAGTWVKFAYALRSKEELEAEGTKFFQAQTFENLKNIDKDYIEDYKKKNTTIDFKRFILGEWIGAEEVVFTEFSEKNIIAPIDYRLIAPNYKKCIGGDYGFRNLATFVWAYKDYDGRIIIYDSWGAAQQSAVNIAKSGLKYGKQPCIYDYSCKEKDKYGFSEWDRICHAGLPLIECSKQDEAGVISYINYLMKEGLLVITSNNEGLINEINNWKYPPRKIGKEENLKETPIDANNHYIDAMKYLINWLEPTRSISAKEIAERNSLKAFVENKNRMKFNATERG